MTIPSLAIPAAGDPSTGTGAAPRTTTGVDPQKLSDQFLQLLVAQIRHQNPLDPRDGAEFFSDLAQMTSVSELVAIRDAVQKLDTNLSAFGAVIGGLIVGQGDAAAPAAPSVPEVTVAA